MIIHKLIALGFSIVFIANSTMAQVNGGKFDKLYDLFEDELYEECLYKAEVLTYKEKTKREPEPYLYLSMCLFNLYKLYGDQEYYSNAFKYSLSHAGKFRRKDKDHSYYDNNIDYFKELKEYAIKKILEWYKEKKYRKISYTYGQILKFDYNDDNIRFMKGVYDLRSGNTYSASKNLKASLKSFNTNYKRDAIIEPFVIEAFIMYSDKLYNNNKLDSIQAAILIDSSRTVMSLANTLFPNDESILEQYKIVKQ